MKRGIAVWIVIVVVLSTLVVAQEENPEKYRIRLLKD